MAAEVTSAKPSEALRQFSVFADNKVGRLHELVGLLARNDVHVMAVSLLDTTDSTIIRLIVDDPDRARALFTEYAYAFSESELIAAEMETEAQLRHVTAALVEAEINIHYVYPFISRPHGRCALVMHVEDHDLAANVLSCKGIRVLRQNDVSR